MKKITESLIIFTFILILFTCNPFSSDEEDYGPVVVIAKAEWDLIEDYTDHKDRPYLPNEDINDESKQNNLNYKNNQQALHNTKQIQAAIDHFTELGFRHIRLEKGEYFVGGRKDSIKWDEGTQNWRNPEAIRIQPKHSGLRFDLGGAVLKLEPHDRQESRVISIYGDKNGPVRDIKVFNGTIIGDRVNHRYADTKDGEMGSHEWGAGIDTGNCENVELYNLTITEVTGDCIGVNGKNLTVRGCNISRGRRNGIVSVDCDGLTIYGNYIHHIYQAGIEYDGYPNSEHEHFGSSIGAEACIAFEATHNSNEPEKTPDVQNIRIFNNVLDGQKPDFRLQAETDTKPASEYFKKWNPWNNGRYYLDGAINFHYKTRYVWVFNNEIIGDIEWVRGCNILIENNRITRGRKGHAISKGLVASGSTRGSVANYAVIRNNYFHNYNVIVGGSAGGVSETQPHWREDYAIVDNVFVYDEPRNFSPALDSNGNRQYSTHYNVGVPMSTGNSYWTALCVSVHNTVVLGNVFDVRDGGTPTGTSPPWVDWRGADITTVKPLACAIYIDVFDHEYDRMLPPNLKVDMYIAGNIYKGPVWREKHYCLNNDRDILNLPQYERPDDPRIPGYYKEIYNYPAVYAKYKEILSKTTSAGNIWGRTK